MPVFTETVSSERDLRILPSLARPLTRLTTPAANNGTERYEVAVIGAGPAGLFLTTLLARYGLKDESMICFDSKPESLKAGQADGLQPRTLEVLQSLDLAHEILTEGCHMREVAFWNPKNEKSLSGVSPVIQSGHIDAELNRKGIERTSFVPDVVVDARFKHEVTIHQGRIERILEESLRRYSRGGINRSTDFKSFELDAASDSEFPIKVTLNVHGGEDGSKSTTRAVRAKYLVGADGAHSRVRQNMGLQLEGETTDHIWGVLDFVCDTDFPDIRKRCAIHSDAGSIMIIPREQTAAGHYLTRLYVQIMEVPTDVNENAEDSTDTKQSARQRRSAITAQSILTQAEAVLYPYNISIKTGTEPDWFAAYQIGQRMTKEFSMKDEDGVERVFIVGDACHTHSPKAGQGMNVSMMDSYNLAWKLAHTINGLSPSTNQKSGSVLSTFAEERLAVAKQLIEFDTKFSSMFSGKFSEQETATDGLTHEQFVKIFLEGSGFTSGCGIEYPESVLVRNLVTTLEESVINGTNFPEGILKPGRRMNDGVLSRYADANPRHVQDELSSTGQYRIIVFTAQDLTSRKSPSARCLAEVCDSVITRYPAGVLELIVVFASRQERFEWADLPQCVKVQAEMKTFEASEELYKKYGLNPRMGAVVIVRPDGYVGTLCAIEDSKSLTEYLDSCLVHVV